MGFLKQSSFNSKQVETRFNEVLSKGSYLNEGEHTVVITAVEFREEHSYIKVTFKSEDDKFHNQTIFLVQGVFDPITKKRSATEKELSNEFIKFMLGLGLNAEQGAQYAAACNTNIHLFQSLCGLKLTIKLAKSSNGVIFNTDTDGQISIVDAGNGKFQEKIDRYVKGAKFPDFSSAKDFVKSTEGILKLAYLEVKAFMEVDDDASTSNWNALRTAVEATTKTVQNKLTAIL